MFTVSVVIFPDDTSLSLTAPRSEGTTLLQTWCEGEFERKPNAFMRVERRDGPGCSVGGLLVELTNVKENDCAAESAGLLVVDESRGR